MVSNEKMILLTGSSGFIGLNLMQDLESSYQLTSISLRDGLKWEDVPDNVNTVIHLAGLAHQMKNINDQKYYDVNEHLTVAFAEGMKKRGTSHFIFFSTIKVYGDQQLRQGVNEDSPCFPEDAYGKSKLNAEQKLRALQDENFTVSIIRPPLVFGAGVKGNLLNIMNLLERNLPLPLNGIQNKRALTSIGNLVILTKNLISDSKNGIFIPLEDRLYSTTELVIAIRKSMGFDDPKIFSTPEMIKNLVKSILPTYHERLYGSQLIENTMTMKHFSFINPCNFDVEIKKMVDHFLASKD